MVCDPHRSTFYIRRQKSSIVPTAMLIEQLTFKRAVLSSKSIRRHKLCHKILNSYPAWRQSFTIPIFWYELSNIVNFIMYKDLWRRVEVSGGKVQFFCFAHSRATVYYIKYPQNSALDWALWACWQNVNKVKISFCAVCIISKKQFNLK